MNRTVPMKSVDEPKKSREKNPRVRTKPSLNRAMRLHSRMNSKTVGISNCYQNDVSIIVIVFVVHLHQPKTDRNQRIVDDSNQLFNKRFFVHIVWLLDRNISLA